LKIELSEIPEEGTLNVEFFEKEETLNQLFKEGPQKDYSFNSPVKASFDISRRSKTVFVEIVISGSLVVPCSRCLAEFQHTIKYSNRLTLFPYIEEDREEVVIESEEADKVFYYDDTLDLGEMLREEISLLLPINILCRDDCKGLCPSCGMDLNDGSCRCARDDEPVDKRFAKLKGLKLK